MTEKALRNVPLLDQQDADHLTGRGDPQQAFRIYRLCVCFDCSGTGQRDALDENQRPTRIRCRDCRGEGKTLDLVATCATPQDVGAAIVRLAEEGEFEGCPIGILKDGGDWLVKPWLPSPRNVSDAARVLVKSKGEKK